MFKAFISHTIGSPRATRFFFDCVAPIYRWLTNNPMWKASLQEMARHFPPSAAELTLLDLGCGHGNSARMFLSLRQDLRVIGLDFSAAMLRMALRMGRGKAERAAWTQADATRLPFPDSSMDAITGHSLYYMLNDRAALLREALRVLRPGGRLILLDPAARPLPLEILRTSASWRIKSAVLLWHAVSRMHDRFTLEQMAAQLSAAGFARVLAESAVEGYGVLSRGEKPYAQGSSTAARIALTANEASSPIPIDSTDKGLPPSALVPIACSALASATTSRTIFVLVRQTPDKPAWALTASDQLQWDAVMLDLTEVGTEVDADSPAEARSAQAAAVLAFTALPKAVAFMQAAVQRGTLFGISKVAKYPLSVATSWTTLIVLNPLLEQLTTLRIASTTFRVDPTRAVTGEE